MNAKNKETRLLVLRNEKSEADLDLLIIKHCIEAVQTNLPETAELLDRVLDKARTLKKIATDALDREIIRTALEE